MKEPGASNRLLPIAEKNICQMKGRTCSPECGHGLPHECSCSGLHCHCVPVIDVLHVTQGPL